MEAKEATHRCSISLQESTESMRIYETQTQTRKRLCSFLRQKQACPDQPDQKMHLQLGQFEREHHCFCTQNSLHTNCLCLSPLAHQPQSHNQNKRETHLIKLPVDTQHERQNVQNLYANSPPALISKQKRWRNKVAFQKETKSPLATETLMVASVAQLVKL